MRYDVTEKTSVEVALAGLKALSKKTSGVKAQGGAFKRPITNFYQTDVISRKYVLSSFVVFLFAYAFLSLLQLHHNGSVYEGLRQRGGQV